MLAVRFASAAALSLLLFGPVQAQPAAPVRVINLVSYAYAPAPIQLAAGRPITLRFVNRAGKGHDFTAASFFRSARILSGRVQGGEVELSPGQTVDITLIPAAGRYNAHCSHPFHKVFGMKSTIVVQ